MGMTGRMDEVADALTRASAGPPNGAALLADALSGMLAWELGPRPPDAGERARIATLLKEGANRRNLGAYVAETAEYAERGRLDGYVPACERRSALQVLVDGFGEHGVPGPAVVEELEEIDEELRAAAEDAPPPHRNQIPDRIPGSHWWWRAPRRTDMSMREYRSRLYGGDLEEFEGDAPGSADWLRCGDEACWCHDAPP
ncbi:hypothetical protein [Thermomonospora amylolytica]|uniref:hypothetical protein n=1 Tax=Thermomonospora amylolytica TaxID=1411117 RepID=UPI000E6C7FC2|nr:hypothetical protein [Thermomonospora amylolytica]